MLRIGGAVLARSVYSRSAGSTHGRSIGPSVHSFHEPKSVILDQTRCFFFGSGSNDDSDGDDKKDSDKKKKKKEAEDTKEEKKDDSSKGDEVEPADKSNNLQH
eukprot:scaffold7754_cov83-Skeletonema_marinoi.AAC.2